uniref:Major facilitator superfamily (MFS) profile domain-containing protein n=1 Tax=Ditylenchus dipsaci TaxID=166011 RepID=A0A915DHH8_9BILA
MSNSLAFNFTVICMDHQIVTDDRLDYGINFNTTMLVAQEEPDYSFSSAQKSWLFSAIAVGTIMGTLPITHLTSYFGIRNTFTAYGLISAFSTLLSPLCAYLGFVPLFIMRVLQGVALSTSYPAMGSIISHWSTLANSGMYIAFMSSRCHIHDAHSWRTVRIILGMAFSLLPSRHTHFAILSGLLPFFRDSPQFHRNVSDKELTKIQMGKNIEDESRKQKTPYKLMLKDISVWGIFVSNIGGTLGFQIFMQYGPIYLNKALKFDVKSTGFAAALPYICSAACKFVAGPLSDNLPVSGKARVIIFATMSQLSMACCFVALAMLPTTYPVLIQACFTGATMFSGLNCVGVAKSTNLMSRQFSHVLMAFTALTCSIILLVMPLGVSILAPNNSTDEWSKIFLIIAVVVVITTLIFDFTAQVDPRPWTYSDVDSLNQSIKKQEMQQQDSAMSKIFSLDITTLRTAATDDDCKCPQKKELP